VSLDRLVLEGKWAHQDPLVQWANEASMGHLVCKVQWVPWALQGRQALLERQLCSATQNPAKLELLEFQGDPAPQDLRAPQVPLAHRVSVAGPSAGHPTTPIWKTLNLEFWVQEGHLDHREL